MRRCTTTSLIMNRQWNDNKPAAKRWVNWKLCPSARKTHEHTHTKWPIWCGFWLIMAFHLFLFTIQFCDLFLRFVFNFNSYRVSISLCSDKQRQKCHKNRTVKKLNYTLDDFYRIKVCVLAIWMHSQLPVADFSDLNMVLFFVFAE